VSEKLEVEDIILGVNFDVILEILVDDPVSNKGRKNTNFRKDDHDCLFMHSYLKTCIFLNENDEGLY